MIGPFIIKNLGKSTWVFPKTSPPQKPLILTNPNVSLG
jgi:hypothetical protein